MRLSSLAPPSSPVPLSSLLPEVVNDEKENRDPNFEDGVIEVFSDDEGIIIEEDAEAELSTSHILYVDPANLYVL